MARYEENQLWQEFEPQQVKPVIEFLDYLAQQKNYSSLTIENYQRQLIKLLQFTKENALQNWAQVKPIHIRQLSAKHHRLGASAKTIALLLSAGRRFFEYLVFQERLQSNPAKGVKAPKIPKNLPKTVAVDQLSALLSGIDTSEEIGVRDLAIAELFYSSGLRLAELVRLNLDDLDINQATARILGKGRKERIVPVGRIALRTIKQWLNIRHIWLSGQADQALFITRQKNRLTPRSIQKRMEYWGKVVGLNGRLHPHKFRHSCATHILESSGDLRAVQELLGHANLSTTQIYTHLDFQQLAKVYDSAHPRAKK
ncbi:tyrosine recombinase XerC [Aliikangiella maris]|uniref:Tyrosine recombinase XerC n=2 Tax=Aliikangiella maris TaxID=3162458 RepID=A0ABV3MQB7_9GAMM